MNEIEHVPDGDFRNLHPLPPAPPIEEMQEAVDVALAMAVQKLGTGLKTAETELAVKISGSLVAIGRLLEMRRQAQVEGNLEIELDTEHDLSAEED